MADPGDLFVSSEELLQASIEALDTIPIFDPTLEGAPERTFISLGAPPQDCCEMLAVHVDEVDEFSFPSDIKRIAGKKNQIDWVVTSSRCYPTPEDINTMPTGEEISEASRQLYADAWALWNHLYNLSRSGALFTLCDEVVFDFMRPLGPSGGCAGWTLALHTNLDGYEEVVTS